MGARWVLALGLVWSAALGWIVVGSGPATVTQDRGERMLFTAVLLIGALGGTNGSWPGRRRSGAPSRLSR